MSVPTGDRPGAAQATFVATLVDEWIRAGTTDAVICPGSRSTPLALALAEREELTVHVRLDERSAGFFALGLARATGRAPVVCVTSGTAAVELHPAVVEASLAGVPLLVCTADRPPELHHVGAPQTIDQTNLYGAAVRWFCEPGVAESAQAGSWRSIGARAALECHGAPTGPGPVHLNLAFRDPLDAMAGPLPGPRTGGGPWHGREPGVPAGLGPAGMGPAGMGPAGPGAAVAEWVGRRGILVVGEGAGPLGDVLQLARRLGWPLLADPRSGCRVDDDAVVAAADAFLRHKATAEALGPDVVVLLGRPWASKVLAGFLAEAGHRGADVVAADPFGRFEDPDRIVTQWIRADPAVWLAGKDLPEPGAGDGHWSKRWTRAESAAQGAIDRAVAEDTERRGGTLSEPALARALLGGLPGDAVVLTSSSMPVRDLEWYGPKLACPPRVVANRGANGIDGVCSTAQGLAAAGVGPVVAVVGDLAFLHDVSSLVHGAVGLAASCTLVVVDNGGGGIFSFLPQASSVEHQRFELLFGTPQVPDVAAISRGFGISTFEATTATTLTATLDETIGRPMLSVIRVTVPDRAENVMVHDAIHAAVARALGELTDLTDPTELTDQPEPAD